MNKKFRLLKILILIFSSELLYSQEIYHNSSESLKISTGILTGEIKELLYYADEDVLLSRLDWDVQAPLISLEDDFFYDSFYGNITLDFGIPCNSGKIQDYDWLNWSNYGTHELSYYSCHENKLEYFYNVNASMGFELPFTDKINIISYFRLGTEGIHFSSQNGFTQYPGKKDGKLIWTPDTPKKDVNGYVIEYAQFMNYAGFGYITNIKPADFLFLKFNTALNIFNYTSFDYHIRKSAVFKDSVICGYSFDFAVDAIYKASEKFNVYLKYKGQLIPAQKGQSYQQYCDAWNSWNDSWIFDAGDQGGLSRYLSFATIGMEINF